ncbi:FAD-dependent thymidylate synthase [Treponema sp.]|uniref:FAD-dependent thymidylate synthase n=1 Tax=Treponema sp. TaxID=166 RepID=UPI0025CE21C4|nr:FAD-dependent thymidylate synthase [Treponema sp.]MCR5217362.1 FAD-dependent thymidylate synthase [Treponema sp.]
MVEILSITEKNPLEHIGMVAGICWNSPVDNPEKNRKRAISCISSGHGRVMEYADAELVISGYSARCIRELYTHIIGTTRLQESTRYVNMEDFKYYTPSTVASDEQKKEYDGCMDAIAKSYSALLDSGVSKEDAANLLPLGMDTKIVLKINLRALIHFMEMRLCTRAYKEIRALSSEIKKVLSDYSEEWKYIAENYFLPKCEAAGFCIEEKCCGRKPKRSEVVIISKEEYQALKSK